MADYVPFTSAPFPTRPDSVMTGMDMGLQDLAIRRAQELAMQDQAAVTRQRDAEYDRYVGMTPGEIAAARLKEAQSNLKVNTPGALEGLLKGELGEAQTKQAKGELDIAANPGRIAAEKSGNQLKVLMDTQNYIDQHANLIRAAEASGMPGAAQAAYGRMLAGLGDHADSFPKEWNPKTAAGLEELRKRLADSVSQRQKIQDIQETAKGNLAVAQERSRGQIAAAGVRAQMGKKDIMDYISKAPLQNKLSVIAMAEMRGDLPPEDIARLKAIALGEISVAYGVKLPPQLAGMPTTAIQDYLAKNLKNYAVPQSQNLATPPGGAGTQVNTGRIGTGQGTPENPIKLR